MVPDCMDCKDVKVEIVDLDNKVLKVRSKPDKKEK